MRLTRPDLDTPDGTLRTELHVQREQSLRSQCVISDGHPIFLARLDDHGPFVIEHHLTTGAFADRDRFHAARAPIHLEDGIADFLNAAARTRHEMPTIWCKVRGQHIAGHINAANTFGWVPEEQ